MKKIFISVGLYLMVVQVFAADCPIPFGGENYLDKVCSAIKSAKTCDDGAIIAENCALGASGDVVTTAVAERKCGLDFWTKLSSSDKQIYNGLQTKCNNKYKNMEGTMYLSANAFCRLDVARLYSELYTSAE